jgi:hypothetical protein
MPDWKGGTWEGSRELDRLFDRQLTFGEKTGMAAEAEMLSLGLFRIANSNRNNTWPRSNRSCRDSHRNQPI